MNTIQRIGLASLGRAAMGDLPAARARVPLEVLLLAMAVAYAVVGPLTDLVWCGAVTSVLATVVTLRRMRAEVRDLRAASGR
jgi:hypothetical protein